MSFYNGPTVVTNGLVLSLDAADRNSYPGSGTTWRDMSGRGNTGTLINGLTFDSGRGGSIVFDGDNDHVTTLFTTNIVTTGFTFSIWFYGTKSTTHFLAAFVKDGDQNTIFRIERFSAGNDTIEFGHSPNGGSIASNELISYNFPNNVWTYCTIIYDGSYKYIYKNGTLDATSSANQTLTYYSDAALRIGARQDGTLFPFGGNIAQVSIYNRALSATEVLQNYNATKSRFGL
jgi:hypothetical protein